MLKKEGKSRWRDNEWRAICRHGHYITLACSITIAAPVLFDCSRLAHVLPSHAGERSSTEARERGRESWLARNLSFRSSQAVAAPRALEDFSRDERRRRRWRALTSARFVSRVIPVLLCHWSCIGVDCRMFNGTSSRFWISHSIVQITLDLSFFFLMLAQFQSERGV